MRALRMLTAAALLGAATPGLACTGDCDGDGQVAINEAIRGVNIALGNAAVGDCAVFDANGDGTVTVNELIAAVANVLGGCGGATPVPTPTATPAVVDDGSVHLGGDDGITGTVNGVVYTYKTVDAFGFPVVPTAIVLGGDVQLEAGYLERWSVHFPNRTGTHVCSETVAAGNTYIRFLRSDALGGITTGRGSCTVTVTSAGPLWEGRFVAVLEVTRGEVEVRAGYFRVRAP